MRIGYPCINVGIGCKAAKTFRLKSYSEERLKQTMENNLSCLEQILKFNLANNLFFFRITSDLIPFASHPANRFNWQDHYRLEFAAIGAFIRKNRMRISMHPDQFTLINSLDKGIFERSKKELDYHRQVLDLMELETSAKIQIHVGGVYGDKQKSIKRFVERFYDLDKSVRRRLVIENDDISYDVSDCLQISHQIQVPVLFDVFHHQINNSGPIKEALELCTKSWDLERDGIPMLDYSSQKSAASRRSHTDSIDLQDFGHFLTQSQPFDFDVMLEIKDKEKSAIKAINFAMSDIRVKEFLESLR